jgi:protein-tyrosine phosphatase
MEQQLHGWRRAAALRRITARNPVRSVLVLCHGNVCRSPFAAFYLIREAEHRGLPLRVASAGFIGPGRAPPDGALRVSAQRDIEMQEHRSTLVTNSVVDEADLVIVMNQHQASAVRSRFRKPHESVLVLGDLDPIAIDARTIVDPWGESDEVFDASYARIERCLDMLVGVLVPNDAGAGAR